jgi:hypothetical protein
MKLPVVITVGAAAIALAISGCAQKSPAAAISSDSPTPTASIAWADMPHVTADNLTTDCSTYADGAIAILRQETDVIAGDVMYRIAIAGCGFPDSEVSAEFMESFVADNGTWASNGLVSGPDVPFNTSGPCTSDNKVATCPAFVMSESGEATGHVEITEQDGGLVWNFVAE